MPVAAHMDSDGTFRAFMANDTDSVQLVGHIADADDHRIVGTASAVQCRRILAGEPLDE